jgi:hypothetical protein
MTNNRGLKMTFKEWTRLDMFYGIEVFIKWCEDCNLDPKAPGAFDLFVNDLKATK